MTYDIRRRDTIEFVKELVDDICDAFPGGYVNVDMTEIDVKGYEAQGLNANDINELVYEYLLEVYEMVSNHDMRLMITQGPLDSVGHLAGLGSKLDTLPSDIIIGSYYCAGGPYRPAWKTDFPRLQKKGFDYFAQAWINSHVRIIPWIENGMDFSDNEVSRGLAHGAIGSLTSDWGEDGNFHFTGACWYSFVYHGASAWTGAKLDRDYFNQAYTRIFYGIADDSVARAIHLAGNINGQNIKVKEESGEVLDKGSWHYWEFFGDPLGNVRIAPFWDPIAGVLQVPDTAGDCETIQELLLSTLVGPEAKGKQVLEAADEAVRLLQFAYKHAQRNRDNIEKYLFGARCYQAMGHKLVVLGHCRDDTYPQHLLVQELGRIIETYEQLKEDFQRIWLTENRLNENMKGLVRRFDNTIVPYRKTRDQRLQATSDHPR